MRTSMAMVLLASICWMPVQMQGQSAALTIEITKIIKCYKIKDLQLIH